MSRYQRFFIFAFLILGGVSLSGLSSRAELTSPRSLFSVISEPPPGLSSQTEAGLDLNSGNTQSNRYVLQHQTSHRFEDETVQAQVRYLQHNANGIQTANTWGVGARYERRIIRRLGGFVAQFLEADRFAGIRQRYATDVGLRKTLWRNDSNAVATELGYRYQFENRIAPPRNYSHIIRIFAEGMAKFSPTVLGIVSVEGLPNVKNSEDWMLNTTLAIQAKVSETFSLKTSYLLRYDHLPAAPGISTMDRSLTTSLVAKF